MKQTYVNIVNFDQSGALRHIKVPTLIIWGRDDSDTPLTMARKMHKRIPNNSLIVYDGGHYMYLDHSREIAEDIDNFVR